MSIGGRLDRTSPIYMGHFTVQSQNLDTERAAPAVEEIDKGLSLMPITDWLTVSWSTGISVRLVTN